MNHTLQFAVLGLMAFTLTSISGDEAASTTTTVAAIKPKENIYSEKEYEYNGNNEEFQCYQCVGCSEVSKSDLKPCSIRRRKNISLGPVNNRPYSDNSPPEFEYAHCVKLIIPGENGGTISRYCDYKPESHGNDACKITVLGPLVYNTCYCPAYGRNGNNNDGKFGCNGTQRLNQSASLVLATLVYFLFLK